MGFFFAGGASFHGCVFLRWPLSVTASVFCRLYPLEVPILSVGGDPLLRCVSGVEVQGCISSWAPCWMGGADLPWVCLRGQGLCLILHCVTNEEKAWPRGNFNKYVSDDDFLKKYLYNGVCGEFLGVHRDCCGVSFSASVRVKCFCHPFPSQSVCVIVSPFGCACLCT